MHFTLDVIRQALTASGDAMMKIILVVLGGVLATYKGIFNEKGISDLGRVVYNITLPALVFTNIVKEITLHDIASYWVLPVFCIIHVFLAYLLSVLISRFLGLKKSESAAVKLCVMFGNVGTLSIAIIQSLCMDEPLSSEIGPSCGTHGISYIAVYLLMNTFLLFTCSEDIVKELTDESHEILVRRCPSTSSISLSLSKGKYTLQSTSKQNNMNFNLMNETNTAENEEIPVVNLNSNFSFNLKNKSEEEFLKDQQEDVDDYDNNNIINTRRRKVSKDTLISQFTKGHESQRDSIISNISLDKTNNTSFDSRNGNMNVFESMVHNTLSKDALDSLLSRYAIDSIPIPPPPVESEQLDKNHFLTFQNVERFAPLYYPSTSNFRSTSAPPPFHYLQEFHSRRNNENMRNNDNYQANNVIHSNALDNKVSDKSFQSNGNTTITTSQVQSSLKPSTKGDRGEYFQLEMEDPGESPREEYQQIENNDLYNQKKNEDDDARRNLQSLAQESPSMHQISATDNLKKTIPFDKDNNSNNELMKPISDRTSINCDHIRGHSYGSTWNNLPQQQHQQQVTSLPQSANDCLPTVSTMKPPNPDSYYHRFKATYLWTRLLRPSWRIIKHAAKTPTIRASALAITCACFPLLQNSLQSGLLKPILEATGILGQAQVPISLLMLSGSGTLRLLNKLKKESITGGNNNSSDADSYKKNEKEMELDLEDEGFSRKAVFAILIGRVVLLPLIGILVLQVFRYLNFVTFFNPLLELILLLQCSVPTAQNIVMLILIHGNPGKAAKLANIILWQYAFAFPILCLYVAYFIIFVDALS